jgi:hypothetical protein
MLWTGRSCRRRQCWLWRKRKRATGPTSAPKLRQNRFKYSATDDAGDPELSGLEHALLFKKLPRPARKGGGLENGCFPYQRMRISKEPTRRSKIDHLAG